MGKKSFIGRQFPFILLLTIATEVFLQNVSQKKVKACHSSELTANEHSVHVRMQTCMAKTF